MTQSVFPRKHFGALYIVAEEFRFILPGNNTGCFHKVVIAIRTVAQTEFVIHSAHEVDQTSSSPSRILNLHIKTKRYCPTPAVNPWAVIAFAFPGIFE